MCTVDNRSLVRLMQIPHEGDGRSCRFNAQTKSCDRNRAVSYCADTKSEIPVGDVACSTLAWTDTIPVGTEAGS